MQILFLLFCSNFYAISEILTYDGIYEEIKTCQAELISKQKNCYEKNKKNLFITINFYGAEDKFMKTLEQGMIKLFNKYVKATNQKIFKKTACYAFKKCDSIEIKNILRFFQNAYIFNNGISIEYKTKEEKYSQCNYDLMQTNIEVDDMEKVLNLQYQEKKMARFKKLNYASHYSRTMYLNDIMMIDNCLSTLEDYELFFNEYIKINNLRCDKTSLIFIILKLDESQKQTFYDTKPWIHLSNISKNNLELRYEAYFLEKRCPFGEFEIDNNEKYVLGKYISRSHVKNEYDDIIYKTQINTLIDVKHTLGSFQCICASSKKKDPNLNSINIRHSFDRGKNHALETINVQILFRLCILNIFHTKKLIEDIKEKKTKIFIIYVILYLDKLEDNQVTAKYAYFMTIVENNISYSFFHDKLIISDEMINQHLRATKLVSNIKSHMNSSFMYYNINVDIHNVFYDDNIYLHHCIDSTLSTIWIPYNYKKTYESINDILDKFVTVFEERVTFILYKYKLSQTRYLHQYIYNENDMFENVKDLTKIRQITIGFEKKLIEERQNYCLQICLPESGITQYYYLFLPTYEFQLLSYNFDYDHIILLFNDSYEKKKENICKRIDA